jgi:hypothetical protein
MRHDFPNDWGKFKAVKLGGTTTVTELTLNLREEHYPFWSKGSLKVSGFVCQTYQGYPKPIITVSNKLTDEPVGTRKEDSMVKNTSLGDLRVGKLTNILRPEPTGTFDLYFNDNSIEDLWLALTWS